MVHGIGVWGLAGSGLVYTAGLWDVLYGMGSIWGMVLGKGGRIRLVPSSGAYRLGQLVNTVNIEGAGRGVEAILHFTRVFCWCERCRRPAVRVVDGDGEGNLEARVRSSWGHPILQSQRLTNHPVTPEKRLPKSLNSRPLIHTSWLGSIWAIQVAQRASFPKIIYIQPRPPPLLLLIIVYPRPLRLPGLPVPQPKPPLRRRALLHL